MHLLFSRLHHGPVEIIDYDPALRADAACRKDGKVSGAAAHIYHPAPRLQLHHLHGCPLPQVMKAKAQQGVHEVIFSGDGVKMALHQVCLFLHRHLLKAKGSCFFTGNLFIEIFNVAVVGHCYVSE